MSAEFKKSLTLYSLTMIAIGSSIGSGIFRTPGVNVAAHVPDAGLSLLVWVLGGVVTLTGALTFAELGTLFTKRGGMYVYQREAFGDLVGFLYGWSLLVVTNTGSIAGLVVVFTEFLGVVVPLPDVTYFAFHLGALAIVVTFKLLLQIGTILILTAVNVFVVDFSKLFSTVFTTTKLIGIVAIIVIGLFFAADAGEVQQMTVGVAPAPPIPTGFALIPAILTAMVGVLWSYGGWQHTTFVVGEAKDPSRTVPRAMIIGAIVVTLVYVLINVAYLKLLPMDVITHSRQIAALAMTAVFGPKMGAVIAALIAISVLGTTGIYILSCPRIYFAMADDGIFFRKLAEIHPKYKTPANAIITQSAWAIFLLLFWGTFENLIDYVTFVDWIFYGITGLTIFVFRRRMPDAARPYKTPFYPLIPLIFCIIAFAFVFNALFANYVQALSGLILLTAGTVVYYLVWKKNGTKTAES